MTYVRRVAQVLLILLAAFVAALFADKFEHMATRGEGMPGINEVGFWLFGVIAVICVLIAGLRLWFIRQE